jgi:hypothetical protein
MQKEQKFYSTNELSASEQQQPNPQLFSHGS